MAKAGGSRLPAPPSPTRFPSLPWMLRPRIQYPLETSLISRQLVHLRLGVCFPKNPLQHRVAREMKQEALAAPVTGVDAGR